MRKNAEYQLSRNGKPVATPPPPQLVFKMKKQVALYTFFSMQKTKVVLDQAKWMADARCKMEGQKSTWHFFTCGDRYHARRQVNALPC
ncbi:hypothetical protein TNCV_1392751 [Trichonephila clavipes]|nr:hypothetical protein TNCV_1392751 [Trichonephila clavipes]